MSVEGCFASAVIVKVAVLFWHNHDVKIVSHITVVEYARYVSSASFYTTPPRL